MAPIVPTISLHGELEERYDAEPVVLRVTTDPDVAADDRHAFVCDKANSKEGVTLTARPLGPNAPILQFTLPSELHHLEDGDVIRVNPQRGEVWVMYRRQSHHNSILLTERCNSFCVMCSQPPKKVDDSYLVTDWKQAIPLMSSDTKELGFTGGEPLLLGEHFFEILELCKEHLPATAIHVLSNGRLFNYLSYARRLREIGLADVMIGIPLYSDIAWRHDFVVQADSAFDQTIRGILNLGRCHVPVEIRVVVHRHTIERLPDLASFICRNLPFVHHVAIMGLEPIGFGRINLDALWIDPIDCCEQLEDAATILESSGLDVSLYNYQLCVLPEKLWPLAEQSISDWKRTYLPACRPCLVKDRCGGFFHSAVNAHSEHIHPVES